MNSGNFFSELKPRNIYKVAVAYAIVGWLSIQITTQVFPVWDPIRNDPGFQQLLTVKELVGPNE